MESFPRRNTNLKKHKFTVPVLFLLPSCPVNFAGIPANHLVYKVVLLIAKSLLVSEKFNYTIDLLT